jgi:S-ribosylhomocysteine lyase LuxS involved in autoinducer biosynthesis
MKQPFQYPYYNGIDTTHEWNTSIAWVSNTTLTAPTPLVMQTGINGFINNIKEQNCTFNTTLSNILNICLPGGIKDEAEQNSISIYPNPFTSQTTISFSAEQKNTIIKITDILGKELKTIPHVRDRQVVIDRGEMKAGIYFVQTMDENKNIINKKIIIP